jgi:hypothetical protein
VVGYFAGAAAGMSFARTSASDWSEHHAHEDITMWQIAVIGLCCWTAVFLLP